MLGLAYLSCGNLELAAEHLNRQVEMLRSSDEWLYLPSGLNARAQYSIAVGDLEKALKDLEEAEDISKRTGAKLGEWDTYLNMAQLHFRNGDHALSNICLEKAAGVPNMQLYTFRDTEISYLRKELDICL
jgi:tetratricopeptide (TPR) repeat protein